MNVNFNIPVELMERIAKALEAIADACDRMAGPDIKMEMQPFDKSLWMESSDALTRQIQEEEKREAEGFGPAYERDLEARAGIDTSRIDRGLDLPDNLKK